MKQINLFGNCQAQVLARCLEASLSKDYSICFISNNLRTGGMKTEGETLSLISQSDYLIYQPLGPVYGELSATQIRNVPKKAAAIVSFPYIFNSGMYSVGHAPFAKGRSYGVIYGEEIIREVFGRECNLPAILGLYRNGGIDFKLGERFSYCMKELCNREVYCDIKLADFIMAHYKRTKLFLTHNHPAASLFVEIIRQIRDVTHLPISTAVLDATRIFMGFEHPTTPISPYDVDFHGYQFPHHEDWFDKGRMLIEAIFNSYLEETAGGPRINND